MYERERKRRVKRTEMERTAIELPNVQNAENGKEV